MKSNLTHRISTNFAIVLIAIISASFCYAQESITDIKYEVDGIHYELIRMENFPMWLRVARHSDHNDLKSVTIPSEMSLKYPGVEENVPAIVEKIGDYAFYDSKIEEITLPSCTRTIGNGAFYSSNLRKVNLPEGVISIGKYAFSDCNLLDSIKIPESVVLMDEGCFYFCDVLRVVDLPSTLKSLGGLTFSFCGQMETLICRATVPPLADDTDLGIINNTYLDKPDCAPGPVFRRKCKLYVPRESIELYKEASMWKRFSNPPYYEIMAIEDMLSEPEIKDNARNAIEYSISNGELNIFCEADDNIAIYDAEGICLLNETITSRRVITHKGKGIRIISVNGKSAKVVL